MREIELNGKSLLDVIEGEILALPRRTYRVEGSASGGMGCVVFASLTDDPSNGMVSSLPRRLALKIPKTKSGALKSELQKWSLMMHANILPLEEILFSPQDGPVAASRRCNGSVRDLLHRNTAFTEKAAYGVVRSCAEALSYAFEKHAVVHLDIKPENVLYEIETNPQGVEHSVFYVTDWGLSSNKLVGPANPDAISLNITNNNAGTLPYMAPERFVRGWHSSPSSDIFSLGMLWVELLSGKLPFNSRTNLLPQILSGDYYAATVRLLDSTPTQPSTKTIILKCIHPEPESRISSWSHLLRKIKPGFLTQFFH